MKYTIKQREYAQNIIDTLASNASVSLSRNDEAGVWFMAIPTYENNVKVCIYKDGIGWI